MDRGATAIIQEIGQLLELRADLAFSSSALMQAFEFLDQNISLLMKKLECTSISQDRHLAEASN